MPGESVLSVGGLLPGGCVVGPTIATNTAQHKSTTNHPVTLTLAMTLQVEEV